MDNIEEEIQEVNTLDNIRPGNIAIDGEESTSSVRLGKLRDYYQNLGNVREMMEKEIEATIKGEILEGEIEDKLYEYSHSWQAIAEQLNREDSLNGKYQSIKTGEHHIGQNLVGVDYSGQTITDADFSAANLQDANFKNAVLTNTDFSGADLSGADLSGADLSDSVFAGAKLKGANFTGANMEGVILRDADIEDAILIDIRMDELALDELQALVEYLALYYPHKLNLRRINVSLLDLRHIDLRYVDLRGVDFTGCDFTGVNIMELDLSSCIITPEQIAQAMGYMPSPEEMKKILAPKVKRKMKKFYIDFGEFLSNGRFTGWIDLTKHKGISSEQLVKAFLNIKSIIARKPEDKDEIIFEKAKEFHEQRVDEERKAYNEEQKKNIEERKQKMIEETKAVEYEPMEEKYTPMKINTNSGRE